MRKNNQSDFYTFAIIAGAIVLTTLTIKLKNWTGLSFDTLASLALNYLGFALAVGAILFFKVFHIKQIWNWALAMFWLASTPALNEWGSGAPSPEFYEFTRFTQLFEPQWYAQTKWQIAVAVGLVASKYILNWIYNTIQDL